MKKIMKELLFCFLVLSFFISLTFALNSTFNNENPKSSNIENDYSDEFIPDNYHTETNITENFYDGVETFYYSDIGKSPDSFLIYNQTNTYAIISESIESHSNVLRLYDNNNARNVSATYFVDNYLFSDIINIDFWFLTTDNTKNSTIYFNQNKSVNYITIRDNFLYYHWNPCLESEHGRQEKINDGQENQILSNIWYNIKLIIYVLESGRNYISITLNNYLLASNMPLEFGYSVEDTFYITENETLESITFETSITDSNYNFYIDALSIYSNTNNDYSEILGQQNTVQEISDYFIYNESGYLQYDIFPINYYPIDSNLILSCYNTLISEYPNSDNNYRAYLKNDNIFNDNLIDNNRLLRFEHNNDIDNKYRVIQFHLNNLDNINSFKNKSENVIENELYDYNSSFSSGIYNATYSFTDDTVGGDPAGWNLIETIPISVISDKNGHDKVVYINDNSAIAGYQMYNSFESGQESGTIEFWFLTSNKAVRSLDLYVTDTFEGDCCIRFIVDADKYTMGFGESWIYYDTIESNVWNHVRIDFECGSGGYEGLSPDSWKVNINDGDYTYTGLFSYSNTKDTLGVFHLYGGDPNYVIDMYLDAIGYSWDANYDVGDNLETDYPLLNEIIELNTIENASIQITNSNNQTVVSNYYIYNTSISDYVSLNSFNSSYNLFTFTVLNDYIIDNKIRIKIMSYNNTYHYNSIFYIKKSYFNTYNYYNNQTIRLEVNSYNSNDLLMNKYFLSIDFNKTDGKINWNALYRKSENIPLWLSTPTNPVFNFNDYLNGESISEIQITIHLVLTTINDNKMFLLRTEIVFNNLYEHFYSYDKIIDGGSTTFYNTQDKISVKFIDYFNFNNYTETITSQYVEPFNVYKTYNNLAGIRTLKLNNTIERYNFLDVGFFKTDLDYYVAPEIIIMPDLPDPPSEPNPPKSNMRYWKYTSWILTELETINTEFSENILWFNETTEVSLNYDYQMVIGSETTVKFYYEHDYLSKNDLGSFVFRIKFGSLGSVKINLSWLRSPIRTIVNTFVVFFYFLVFLGFIALNVLLYIFIVIILPFWINFVGFWLLYGIVYVVFLAYFGLMFLIGALWTWINWLYENLLIPFTEWFLNDFLPILFEILVVVFAFLSAVLIWAISGGTADFNDIYNTTYTLFSTIADFLLSTIYVIVDNIYELMLYIFLYLYIIAFCYLKHIYCKSKGLVNRADQLENTLEAYKYPITIISDLIKEFKEVLGRWM